MTLGEKFSELRSRGEKALVLFVTAGDPSLDQLPAILSALEEGGADIIELGVPFSDPIADGPTIQASTQRALDRGVTPPKALEALAASKVNVPVVVMGYYNPIHRVGVDSTAEAFRRAGVAGSIVTDVTPDEAGDWIAASRKRGLDNIFLAAPTSTESRLDEVCRNSSGFVYAVSRMGVTSASVGVPPEAQGLVRRIKERTDLPVCVGFGVSTPEHVRMVCEVADGAVIGSWLVDQICNDWNDGAGRGALIDNLRALKAATRLADSFLH